MKTTIVTFKALTYDGKIVHKRIPIHHNFEEIPPTVFHGVKLPKESVESQVIDFLDEQDKTKLMQKHQFEIIFDYYVKPKKPRRTKKKEMEEFIEYCKPLLLTCPQLEVPFMAIVSESKDILFGKGKSNKDKLNEVMKMHEMILLGVNGVLDSLLKKMHEYDKNLLT